MAGPRTRLRHWRRRTHLVLFCYAALLPVLALFFYVRVVPIGFSVLLSFRKWDLISPFKPFIGLENYVNLLQDDNFVLALENTVIYAAATVVISAALALPLALFLSRKSRLAPFYQTIYFLPFITPLVPMSIAWKWIYDYNYGAFNYVLSLLGIRAVPWLTDPDVALWALIIMSIWRVLGYNMILFLVGIRNIPAPYLEAASLDGAGAWQRFRHVTLPLLRPILLYVLVTSTITSFQVFTQVYVMTLGSQTAPGNALRVLVYDIYENAFTYHHMGYASSEAVVLTLLVLGVTVVQFTIARNDPAKEA